METALLPIDKINSDLKNVFGSNFKVLNLTEIIEGCSKHTYKIETNSADLILHVWKEPYSTLTSTNSLAQEIIYGSGFNYFKRNHDFLKKIGVNVPDLIHFDSSKSVIAFDYAYLECIPDGDLKYRRVSELMSA